MQKNTLQTIDAVKIELRIDRTEFGIPCAEILPHLQDEMMDNVLRTVRDVYLGRQKQATQDDGFPISSEERYAGFLHQSLHVNETHDGTFRWKLREKIENGMCFPLDNVVTYLCPIE